MTHRASGDVLKVGGATAVPARERSRLIKTSINPVVIGILSLDQGLADLHSLIRFLPGEIRNDHGVMVPLSQNVFIDCGLAVAINRVMPIASNLASSC